MNARRPRRRRRSRNGQDIKKKIISIVVITTISMLAGYVTATYIIGPLLGLETEKILPDMDKVKIEEKDDKTDKTEETKVVIEDQIQMEASGYALQYGSFSTKAAAEKCVSDLKQSGIEAEIIEKDGAFKVIGELFSTEQEARTAMEQHTGPQEVFLTHLP